MKLAPYIPIRDILIFPGIITPIFIGREKSMKTLETALLKDNKILLFLQKDKHVENPKLPEDINKIGILANIIQTLKVANGTTKVLLEAKERVELINDFSSDKEYFECEYEEILPEIIDEKISEALRRKVIVKFEEYGKTSNKILPEIVANIKSIKNLNRILDIISANLFIEVEKKQSILEINNLENKTYKVLELLNEELEILKLEKKINTKVKEQMNNVQKNFYLREKIKAMREEIGETNNINTEADELKSKMDNTKYPTHVKDKIMKEIDKLSKMSPYSSEASVIRLYVELLMELPWTKKTRDVIDMKKAEKILEDEHYGLEEVKERILEFLAVRKLNKSLTGSILCLAGPPGVGKSSLAKSVASALGRKFSRISLGGVKDEAEIRGHRRTYVGAMPGRIIKEIKKVNTKNPLILLDEIDKMAMDFRGDPASALLEVLDPVQNKEFEDHYIDMPFDLSEVFFIATANDLGAIPGPLRDRMEIINLTSYTEFEKLNIAKKYLIPESKLENGLKNIDIILSDESIFSVINEYTKEAGVRNLKREFDKIFRKIAKLVLETNAKKYEIKIDDLKSYLGKTKYRPDKQREKAGKIGIVNGLAWTSVGGTTLEVQAVKIEGKGKLILTGKLGEVMKESAQVAYTYVRAKRDKYKIEEKFEEKYDLHMHFPEGAVPKDGPSAGTAITTAILSSFTDRKIKQNVAMTGEITITGEVLAIGGVKEKVIGAKRAGINEIILPIDNQVDVDELPKEIIKDLKFHFVECYDEIEKIVFCKK
ncbi:MAG: endopeptidase La [Fusobacteria bacterium]|nr:endopeptidase La [Fusobacteriota bacterium]